MSHERAAMSEQPAGRRCYSGSWPPKAKARPDARDGSSGGAIGLGQ